MVLDTKVGGIKITTMKEIKECPYCGSKELIMDGDYYFCKECENFIHHNTLEFEDLRHKISAVISSVYGSEDNPLVCKTPITIGEDESQGLSESEKPKVISMFHDNEGIVWFNIEYYEEPVEFDKLTLSDVKSIWNKINEKII